jgi:UDP-glucuronate 4-epimerase
MSVIVTGVAGFIGFHVAKALLARGEAVVGIDNLNSYYDVKLKEARLAQLADIPGFTFHQCDVSDREAIAKVFDAASDATGIVHLAAQAGVRYSLENPYAYVEANVMGQVVMFEAARRLTGLRHLVYASSSSVYGSNTEMPFSIEHRVDHPVSLYAATKKAGELIAHTYAHLYAIPSTGLRFFTVYGPWGRPDMAYYLFADAIMHERPIKVFNHGQMRRDFTYIDDIVSGVLAALDHPPTAAPGQPPCRVYNLGNSRTETLGHFIETLEKALGRTAIKEMLPMQPGDVVETSADIDASRRDLGFEPTTRIEDGLGRFATWYLTYHGRN